MMQAVRGLFTDGLSGKEEMNMSITISSYLNSTQQSMRTTSAEKLGQTERTTEAGKTQQSAVSASLDQVNMGEDGLTVTQVSRQQGATQSTSQRQPASPQTDTVEISEEGIAALQKQPAEEDTAAEYLSETEDLSEYTDSELRQMYYRGEITQQEYETETGEALG